VALFYREEMGVMKINRMIIRMIIVIISLLFYLGSNGTNTVLASTNNITTAVLEDKCSELKYYHNTYWTDSNGNYYNRNGRYLGTQCWAFARYFMWKVTGDRVEEGGKWKRLNANSVSELQIGDIVCVGDNIHTAVVFKKLSNGNYEFIQAEGSNNNRITKTAFEYYKSVNGKYKYFKARNLNELKNQGLVYIIRYYGEVKIAPKYNYKTGTYQTSSGSAKAREIHKSESTSSTVVAAVPANAQFYVKSTKSTSSWGYVEYKANNHTYTGYMNLASLSGYLSISHINNGDITPKAITSAPVVKLSTATPIAKGKTSTVTWNAVANATSYTVTVKRGNTVIKTENTFGTSYSTTLDPAGGYTINVQAKNSVFWSGLSNTVSIDAKDNVKVIFKDYDGTIISEQSVKYGENASVPQTPNKRKGYTFRQWDKSYWNVTQDTIITAEYDINQYNVRFFDGNKKQIGVTQKITYLESATAPSDDSVAIREGYTFIKWDRDFSCITENTDVYAVSAWADSNLPIKILSGATALQQVDDGVVSSYKVEADLRNINTEDTTGRAILALKTKDGDLLTTTESKAFTVKNGVDYHLEETIPYTGQATRAEIYIVNGYQYTSNVFEVGTIPLSEKVTIPCERLENSLAYSDWTTDAPPEGAFGVESKVQYSSRPISDSVTYKHKYFPNDWSAYGTTALTGNDNRKVTSKTQYQYRDVGAWGGEQSTTSRPTESKLLTITGQSTNYYYYHYCNQYTNGSYGADSVSSGSRNGTTIKSSLGKCVYKRTSLITATKNWGDIGNKTQYYVGTGCSKLDGVTRCGRCGATGWTIWYYDKEVTTYRYKTRSWGGWSAWQDAAVGASDTREVNTRTVYAYKDAQYFYDNNPTGIARAGYTYDSSSVSENKKVYGDWNEWQDTEITANETTDVRTRTVYRWKTKEEITIGDEVSGKAKGVSGNISSEYAGREAILFVYKHGDASDYTTEYIGQAKLGEDGTFEYNFKTREEPSPETGDFTATLGIAGTDKVIILDENNFAEADQFKAPKNEYKVEFVDKDDKILSTQTVEEGKAAIIPEEIPEVEGYIFSGWNTNVAKITSDYTVENGNPIRAEYKQLTCDVTYIDWDGKTYETKTYTYGSALKAPTDIQLETDKEGYDKKWNMSFDGDVFVKNDMIVTALLVKKTCNVTYYDMAGEVYSTYKVDYGDVAVKEDYRDLSTDKVTVIGWKTDDESQLMRVTKDIELYPDYYYLEDVSEPVASVKSGTYDSEQVVTLSTDNVDDDIYYTVDGSDPKINGVLFKYPIKITSTCSLNAYAKRNNANSSSVSSYYYSVNIEDAEPSEWCLYDELPDEVKANTERYNLESATGYRYTITKQVMSDEDASKLVDKGWIQIGSVMYTEWSEFMEELPDNIGDVDVEINDEDENAIKYRYRYAIRTYSGKSSWQIEKPNVDKYEEDTVYRYKAPNMSVITIVAPDLQEYRAFGYIGEKLGINVNDYVDKSQVVTGIYKDAEYTEAWDADKDIIEGDMTLYLDGTYKELTVTYYDKDKSKISTEKVSYGGDAKGVDAPEVEGFTFVGWDKPLENITEDTDLYAQYKDNKDIRKLKLSVDKKSIFTNTTFEIKASVEGENEVNDITWKSSDSAVATVSAGIVKALRSGTTTIEALLSTGEKAECIITVIADEEYELLLKQLSELKMDRDKSVLIINEPKKVSEIKTEFVNDIKVYNSALEETSDDQIVATGYTVKASNNEDELTTVLLGDIKADSVIDESDLNSLKQILENGYDESDVGTDRYLAADINQSGEVDWEDVYQLEKTLGLEEVFVVTYEMNGKGEELGIDYIDKGEKITEPTVEDADGYKLEGWYTDVELTNKYDFDTEVNSDITLYAKWKHINHTEVAGVKVDPTCTEPGKTAGTICSECGEVISTPEDVEALGHKWDKETVIKEASCTEKGLKQVECSRCGEKKTEDIAAKGHNWNDGVVVTAPTITTAGVKLVTCETCGNTKLVDIPKLEGCDHEEEVIPAVEATCTEKGKTAGKKCSKCGEILEAQTDIPALGHDWDDSEITKEATCSETGIKTFHCKREGCEETKSDEIKVLDHHEEIIPEVAATCTEKGKTAGKKCSVCGTILETQKEVPEIGHKWDDGKVTKEPTETEKGIKTYMCSVCKITKTEEIPELGKKDSNNDKKENEQKTSDQSSITKPVEQQSTVTPVQTPTEQQPVDIKRPIQPVSNPKMEEGVGTISGDGKTITDADGTKYLVSEKVTAGKLAKNASIADKKSAGKYKITKVIKQNGKVTGGTVVYKKPYNKNCNVATIKSTVKLGGVTFKVTSVADNAFKDCKKLTKVTIGKNVTQIGTNSFSGCKSLKTVVIQTTTLNKIKSNAFKNINANAKFKVPKKKLDKYTKMIKKAGAPKKATYNK
jgi:uncharacterized repeat protein (TIGR02543 family)